MKNKSIIFATYFAKVCFIFFAFVGFFIATNSALNAANTGYQPLSVYHNAKNGKCTLASSGEDSLPYFKYFNFSTTMPKYKKNQSSANSSTATLTHDCESVNPNVLSPLQKLTVSENTYAYLKCLRQLNTLWECIYKALELDYGWESADEIMQEEYHDKSEAIRDIINSYMCTSIYDRMSSIHEITEI